MKKIRHRLRKLKEIFLNFLKYKKHLYVKPLYVLMISILFIAVFIYLIKKDEPDEVYTTIEINFEKPTYKLNGVKIILDPGHGGEDPGAPSIFGKNEAHVVYTIAEKLKKVLEDSGAIVHMTRTERETVELDDRKLNGDIFVSIHSDAFTDNEASGFTTFYLYENQRELAEKVNDSMNKYALITNRGTEKMGYQVIWQLDYPATLVELGYLSNTVDDSLLNDSLYQDRMAQAIAEGIDNFVNKEE